MDEKQDEIREADEDRKYKNYAYDGFKLRTGNEALENFQDKIEEKVNAEELALAWTQAKLRLVDPKKPAKSGAFDRAAIKLTNHIFDTTLKDARKQTKLVTTERAEMSYPVPGKATNYPHIEPKLAESIRKGETVIGKARKRGRPARKG